jgi:hypothetical protein
MLISNRKLSTYILLMPKCQCFQNLENQLPEHMKSAIIDHRLNLDIFSYCSMASSLPSFAMLGTMTRAATGSPTTNETRHSGPARPTIWQKDRRKWNSDGNRRRSPHCSDDRQHDVLRWPPDADGAWAGRRCRHMGAWASAGADRKLRSGIGYRRSERIRFFLSIENRIDLSQCLADH